MTCLRRTTHRGRGLRAYQQRVLVAVMATGLGLFFPSLPAGAVAGFGDVEHGQHYDRGVQWMVDGGFTDGTAPGCFSPQRPVTRGQAAAFLWRISGRPVAPAHPFVDVDTDWQQDAVSWLFAQGITTGTTGTTFSPTDPVSRGQFAALLWRMAGRPPAAPAHPFVDVDIDWQQDAVSWLASERITTGTSEITYSPTEPVTRGEIATFLWRYQGRPPVVIDPTETPCRQIEPPRELANPGDVKNCSDFASQLAAQVWFDRYSARYGDVARLDGDRNGRACEENG